MTIYSLDVLLYKIGTSLLFMSASNCCFLTCVQILRRQVRWYGISISLRIFRSLLWSTQWKTKVNEADVFLEFPCFLYDPTDVGNLISGSSAFSKSNLNIWKFLVHVMLKPTFENFCITLLVCEMSAIVQLNLHNIKQTILKGTIQK